MDHIVHPPVQQRMMDILKDGKPHTTNELYLCLDDDLARKRAISPHICKIRKRIRPHGYDIVTELFGNMPQGETTRYRLVRMVGSSDE